jgi:hypothetical protein
MALLIVAWRFERVGGAIFVLLGFVFTFFFRTYREPVSFMIITVPVLLIGTLFILDYYTGRKAIHE